MATSMSLSAYLKLVAERLEAAEEAHRPAEVLRLIEVMRDELSDQVTKRVAALHDQRAAQEGDVGA